MLQKDHETPGIELNDEGNFQELEGICQLGRLPIALGLESVCL